MTKNTKNFVLPLTFIGIMFFAIGFALGINSLLVPVLQNSLGISNTASYLIIAATFIPFLVFGYPAGLTIKAIGYKRTMSLSFFIFAAAFYLFILSADQKSFTLFLLASFISGAANAYLQASVNPYITILGPLDSAAKRISIMGICNKLAWPIPAIFIVWLLGKDVNLIGIEDLNKPFIIIICAFVALGVMAFFAPLPEVKAAGEDENENTADANSYATRKTSVFQFPHLLLGCLALFLYVGVETVSLGTLVDYAKELGLEGAANYAWIAPIGIVIGYICGIIFIPKYLNQATALKICSILAIIGSLLVVLTPSHVSIYFIHGFGMFADVAGSVAACYSRSWQVYKSWFILTHHGNVRWSRYSNPLWLVKRRSHSPTSLLVMSPLLPIYPILWSSRIQNQNEISEDIQLYIKSHSSKEWLFFYISRISCIFAKIYIILIAVT